MCVAGSRTFVHESVYDEYLERAKARAENRVVGDPFKSGVEHGPQVRVSNYELSCENPLSYNEVSICKNYVIHNEEF